MQHIILVTALALISVAFGLADYTHNEKDKTLFVHSVYFWLNEDVTQEERSTFIDLLEALEQIKSVDALEIGIPAGTPRAVVDNSYDIALLVYFNDKDAHDFYQSDPIHKSAVGQFEKWVSDVKIYDAICER